MNETGITLAQSPVITHKLMEVGKNVDARITSLNLDKQVATVETVKCLKELRAELNNELTEFEDQRKFVKRGILSPYEEFESLYKVQISEKYNGAIAILKDKIGEVETMIKTEKRDAVKRYFDELCAAEKIDFVSFEKVVPEINLSTSEKKYKEQVNEAITKVTDDLRLISTTEHQAEIMTEYKKTLNVSQAITTVNERKENERLEEARIKAERKARRIRYIKEGLGMVYVDITDAWELDEKIYILDADVDNLVDADYQKKIAKIEQAIKDKKSFEFDFSAPMVAQEHVNVTPAAPVEAPNVELKEEIVTASFKVTGTMSQLRALGAYMKANGINYQNI